MGRKPSINPQDIIGKQFDRLTVLEYKGKRETYREHTYLCRCTCGKEVIVNRNTLLRSSTFHSCGCYSSQFLTSGDSERCSRAGLGRAKINPDGVNESMIFREGTIQSNTSGVQGVSWSKTANKWHVYVGYKLYRCNLGFVEDLQDAIKLHDMALEHIKSGDFEDFFYELRGFRMEDKLTKIQKGR